VRLEIYDCRVYRFIHIYERRVNKRNRRDLERFINNNPTQQLDTETNVTEHYTLRELYVIQLGT
jgi:hypothetical protein